MIVIPLVLPLGAGLRLKLGQMVLDSGVPDRVVGRKARILQYEVREGREARKARNGSQKDSGRMHDSLHYVVGGVGWLIA